VIDLEVIRLTEKISEAIRRQALDIGIGQRKEFNSGDVTLHIYPDETF
jgi:hypothetical protein